MIFPYFTTNQAYPLLLSTILLTASVICFQGGRKTIALILLFIGAIGVGYFITNLDPFLILWDEQYHALVAKNLTTNFLKPTLYATPILDYDYRNWTDNHIWLHKQPLFLWQIALSLKVFGINELAVRIPSVLMHAIAALMIYRIGKIFYNSNVGYYSALFFSVAFYPLEMVAGRFSTDHNDVAFLFNITASFWSWFEYQYTRKSYWLIMIGIFSGCAVLVKWLPGLLIYPVWIISIGVNDKKNWLKLKSYLPFALSLLVALLIFLPWQLYIFNKYPQEARFELSLNHEHFFKPVEDHGGNIWFHFNAVKNIYGSGILVPWLLLAGLFLLIKNSPSKIYKAAILSAIILTYGFYTIAATKMISFCIIVSPFAFLGLGALTDSILNATERKINSQKFQMIFTTVALITVSYFLLNLSKIQNNHTMWKPNDNGNRKSELAQMNFIHKLKTLLHDEKYVVFNSDVRMNGHIAVMFYTNYTAYGFIPTQSQVQLIKMKGFKLVVLDTGTLPEFIRNDNVILKIKL